MPARGDYPRALQLDNHVLAFLPPITSVNKAHYEIFICW